MNRLTLIFGLALLCLMVSQSSGQELKIGDKAPSLDIQHWVSDGKGKFPHVKEFESGKVYVVEFWATWCGPCIAAMPEIKAMQEEFASKSVQVISVSDEGVETVEKFLQRKVSGAAKTYGELTASYCLTTDPDGSVSKDYMEAAGQNGIPTAFLVGKSGLIEWIGHPLELKEVLVQLLAGKWDREAYAKQMAMSQEVEMELNRTFAFLEQGKFDIALKRIDASLTKYKDVPEFLGQFKFLKLQASVAAKMEKEEFDEALSVIRELTKDEKDPMILSVAESMGMQIRVGKGGESAVEALKQATIKLKDQPVELNGMAWTIVELVQSGKKLEPNVIAAGVAAAKVAAKAAPEDGSVLDTYANLLYLQGKLDEAIAVQKKAAKLEPEIPEISAFLEKLLKEKAGDK